MRRAGGTGGSQPPRRAQLASAMAFSVAPLRSVAVGPASVRLPSGGPLRRAPAPALLRLPRRAAARHARRAVSAEACPPADGGVAVRGKVVRADALRAIGLLSANGARVSLAEVVGGAAPQRAVVVFLRHLG